MIKKIVEQNRANQTRKKWDIRYIVSCSIWIETIIKSRALTIYQQKLLYLKYMANKQNTSISSHKYAIYKEGRWHSAYCWLPLTKGNNEKTHLLLFAMMLQRKSTKNWIFDVMRVTTSNYTFSVVIR